MRAARWSDGDQADRSRQAARVRLRFGQAEQLTAASDVLLRRLLQSLQELVRALEADQAQVLPLLSGRVEEDHRRDAQDPVAVSARATTSGAAVRVMSAFQRSRFDRAPRARAGRRTSSRRARDTGCTRSPRNPRPRGARLRRRPRRRRAPGRRLRGRRLPRQRRRRPRPRSSGRRRRPGRARPSPVPPEGHSAAAPTARTAGSSHVRKGAGTTVRRKHAAMARSTQPKIFLTLSIHSPARGSSREAAGEGRRERGRGARGRARGRRRRGTRKRDPAAPRRTRAARGRPARCRARRRRRRAAPSRRRPRAPARAPAFCIQDVGIRMSYRPNIESARADEHGRDAAEDPGRLQRGAEELAGERRRDAQRRSTSSPCRARRAPRGRRRGRRCPAAWPPKKLTVSGITG